MDSVCSAMGGHHLCWSRLYAAASLELGFSFLALLGGFVNLRILVEAQFLSFLLGVRWGEAHCLEVICMTFNQSVPLKVLVVIMPGLEMSSLPQ